MIALLVLFLLALGLLLVSFLSSVLRDIGEIKRSLRQLDEDVREIKRHTVVEPPPWENAKNVTPKRRR
jgi:uncharacterized protein YoxC